MTEQDSQAWYTAKLTFNSWPNIIS